MGIVCRHDQESAYISSRLWARLERKYIGMAGVCDGTMTFGEHKINLKQHAQMMLIIISRFSAINCVKVHRYTLVSFMYSHRNKCTPAYYYWHGNYIVHICIVSCNLLILYFLKIVTLNQCSTSWLSKLLKKKLTL